MFEDVKLPDGKVLVPGVIDSTTNYVEHPELVAQRIVRYAGVVGRENVIASSDCGFATFASSSTVEPRVDLGEAGGHGRGSAAGEPGAVALTPACRALPPRLPGPGRGARVPVGRQQLAVVPGDDAGRLDDVAEALARGVLDVVVGQALVPVERDPAMRRPIASTPAGSSAVLTTPCIWTPRRSKYSSPVSTRQLIRGSRARFSAFCEDR